MLSQNLITLVEAALAVNDLVTAEQQSLSILASDPAHPTAWFFLGVVHAGRREYAKARTCLDFAVKNNPDNASLWHELGFVAQCMGDVDEARLFYTRAIQYRPERAESHFGLAATYALCGDVALATNCYREALRLKPDFSYAWNNLGLLLHDDRQFAAAELCYRNAITSDAKNTLARVNLSLTLLMVGRYREAWPFYEARQEGAFQAGNDVTGMGSRQFSFPLWRGEPLDGKSLLVWPEQGRGDILQFVRFLPTLRERYPSLKLSLACWPELTELLNSVSGVDILLQIDGTAPVVPHDFWCPITSLPFNLNVTLESIPVAIPYLFASESKIASWSGRLTGIQPRVGLVWAGGGAYGGDADSRSLPLRALVPLLIQSDVTFVSLQKGVGQAQLAELPAHLQPVDFMDDVFDFSETAAVIQSLDLVITVDTSVAHLAGALGKPVWILLRYQACWRWLAEREDSPWYPGVARLFRQSSPNDWGTVIAEVSEALREFRLCTHLNGT